MITQTNSAMLTIKCSMALFVSMQAFVAQQTLALFSLLNLTQDEC